MNDLLVGAASGVVCAVGALAVPGLLARLPEPEPDPVAADGVELTAAEKLRAQEPPKELYADIATSPGLVPTLAWCSLVAGALLGWRIGADWLLLLLLPLVPVGAALGVVDLRTRLLPRVPVLAATAAALVYGVVAWPLSGSHDALLRGVIGLLVARGVFWVLYVVSPRGMGYGDVRLAALTGFVLAYVGWAELVVGVYSPFLLFGLPGLALAVARRNRTLLKQTFPFGPFLLVGVVVGVLLGDPVMHGLVNR